MSEVTIVELSPQLVLGMRKTGSYKEIPIMFQRICEFAFSKNVPITAYPAFLCHEITVEEVQKADEEGNADIEVIFPTLNLLKLQGMRKLRYMSFREGKWQRLFIRALTRSALSLMKNYFSGLQKTEKESLVLSVRYIIMIREKFSLKRY
jgi:hypothetical protein